MRNRNPAAIFSVRTERHAFEQVRDKVGAAVLGREALVRPQDVRVHKAHVRTPFLEEALEDMGVADEVSVEDLDRNRRSSVERGRFVYRPHSATPELPDEPESTR
jgi:hypothetical protein